MTVAIQRGEVRNRLLASLPDADFECISLGLEPMVLSRGLVLETPGEPVEDVVFVESGIASRIVVGAPHGETECGHVGFEGMTGKPVILGGRNAINRIEVRVPGIGLRIAADRIKDLLDQSRTFRDLMNTYVLACEIQTEHTLLAATNYTINQRLARWLLMYQDRTTGEELAITHDVLSDLLNVRRASITQELHVLEGIRAIRSNRGSILIRDRSLLIDVAGGSYGIPEREYEMLIPSPAAASGARQDVP